MHPETSFPVYFGIFVEPLTITLHIGNGTFSNKKSQCLQSGMQFRAYFITKHTETSFG